MGKLGRNVSTGAVKVRNYIKPLPQKMRKEEKSRKCGLKFSGKTSVTAEHRKTNLENNKCRVSNSTSL